MNYFDMPHHTQTDTRTEYQFRQRFIAQYAEMDVFTNKVALALTRNNNPLNDTISKIANLLKDARSVMPHDSTDVCVIGTHKDSPIFIWIDIETPGEAIKFEITVSGSANTVEDLINIINDNFHQENMAAVKWWFNGAHGVDTKDFYLPPEKNKLLPEFYPDLPDPEKFLEEYMAADESVLLLAGPPGTGKTTLLRFLLNKYKLTAHVIYDEGIMRSDIPFQQFMFEQNGAPRNRRAAFVGGDVMIVEDADTILMSREDDGNKLMARFLNVTDGLIKLPNKKLIFTTNISDFSKVDSALLRPGRCFAVMHSRLLNLTEAQAAAKAANMPVPEERGEYSLAEIFNPGKKSHVRTIGFGARH